MTSLKHSPYAAAVAALLLSSPAYAAVQPSSAPTNSIAIVVFVAFVIGTLYITWRAAQSSKSRESFLTAGGTVSPVQNGFALAGDFMSAATLLGITSLVFFTGLDGLVMSFTVIIGWALALVLIAEKLRNLGTFTFADVISYRFDGQGVRVLLAVCSLIVILFYLIGQMVGAGKLIELLFGLPYGYSVALVSAIMVACVYFGGMIATTWVQMIKAAMLILGGLITAGLILAVFDFDFSSIMAKAAQNHPRGAQIAAAGGWLDRDPFNIWTVGLTMTFGIMGLPHILMRFLTVKDGRSARLSVGYATALISLFYLLVIVIGFGAIALVWGTPEFYDSAGELLGGNNMVAMHAASAVGGEALLGYMAAVAFATILAVVAGLSLSGAAAVSHDLYGIALKKGQGDPKTELKISRLSILGFGILAVVFGLLFENQNIAVIVSTALAVAASVNFPLLALAINWRGLTARGALIGGGITLIVSVVIIVLSDGVWVQVLGNEDAFFPYIYPTVLTMPLGFLLPVLVSKFDTSARASDARDRFNDQLFRAETGIGAVKSIQH